MPVYVKYTLVFLWTNSQEFKKTKFDIMNLYL